MAQQGRWQPPAWACMPSKTGELYMDVIKEGQIIESIPVDTKDHILVGRNSAVVDYPIDHPSSSRQHAALVHRQDGSVVLIDINSAHGTFLDSTRIESGEPAVLECGEPFTFGSSSRRYVLRRSQDTGPNPMKMLADGYADEGDDGRAHASQTSSENPSKAGESRRRDRRQFEAATEEDIRRRPTSFSDAPSQYGAATISAPLSAASAAAYVMAHSGIPQGLSLPMTVEQKKKMLWGDKKAAVATVAAPVDAKVGSNRWDAAEFQDKGTQDKFRKLMGVKDEVSQSGPDAAAPSVMKLDQQQRLQNELEREFHEGLRRRGGGTYGLGL